MTDLSQLSDEERHLAAMNQTPKLKPCPFCGKPAILKIEDDHHGEFFELGCPDKECVGNWAFYTELIENLDASVKAWNTRAESELLTAANEMERERDRARRDADSNAANGMKAIDALERVTADLTKAEQQRDAATEALKRARVAIEKAPHPSSCDGWRAVSGQTLIFRAKRCDCWKAAALHDLAAAETDK